MNSFEITTEWNVKSKNVHTMNINSTTKETTSPSHEQMAAEWRLPKSSKLFDVSELYLHENVCGLS